MKKNLLSFILCFSAFCFFGTLNAQTQPIYQLPNGGFEEEWYPEIYNPLIGQSVTYFVPTGFYTFGTASGSLASTAAGERCGRSTDVRAGATGNFSLRLFSNTVLGVRANGNVTTGRINAGSMTANNQDNYNYTNYQSAPKHVQEFTGTPDSLRFWVKYLPGRSGATNTTDRGRVRVYIHGTGECRDAPQYPSGMTETQLYYGKAMKEFYKEDGGWHCYKVPFEYTGTNTQKNANGNYYVLLSMTTNATPGGGANSADQVWFDDIEFIYSAWLTDLKVNGETIDGFQKKLLTYGGPKLTGYPPYDFPYQPEDFSWTTELIGIVKVEATNKPGPDGDANGGYTSILVSAQDDVDPTLITSKEYRIYYFSDLSDDNTLTAMSYTMDGQTLIPVPGFTPSQVNYPISLLDPEEVRVPQIVESSIVFSDPTASIQSIVQPTGVNARGTAIVRAENYSLKSYNLLFTKAVSSNAKLNWIRIGGTNIPDFDPDTLTYNHTITACTTTIPVVTHEKSSAWANVSYTAATMANRTATLVVTAEDGITQRTYKINFIFTNDNVAFTNFRFGTSTTNQILPVAGDTVYERAFSFTAAQAVLTPTLSCSGATFTRKDPATVYFPDTNCFYVTALDGVTKQTYKIVVKNTNCYLATGVTSNVSNSVLYNYNGQINQNSTVNITTAQNNNTNTVITTQRITLPVGPPVPPEIVVRNLATAANAAPPTYIIKQPISRTDTADITLTANDGVTKKTYRVPIVPTYSTDATLKNITYNEFNVPGFAPATEDYLLIFPSNVTEVPEIVATPNFQWLPEDNIVITNALTLSDTTQIEVTAENGTTKKVYRIAFEVVAQEEDAYLTDIRYDNVTIPNFNPTMYNYTIDIPYSDPVPPQITVQTSSPTALPFFAGQLPTPPYTQKVLIYSEDMSVYKIYSVDFNRVKNINSALTDIKINGVSLQNFNAQEFEYEYDFPYTEWNAPVVAATPAYPNAQVNIEQIDAVTGTVTITVTAEDDTYVSIYTIDFTRALSPVTNISTVVYDYNNQINSFEVTNNETEITIVLPVETEGEPVIDNILLADTRADFVIEEQPDATNDFTGTVVVTAEDLTEETYSIIFEKTLSGSTLLAGIYIEGVPLQNFDPDVLTYEVMLPFNESQIQNVTATAAWKNTVVGVAQASHPFGQATISVTSEDEQNHENYTIYFQRKGNPYLIDLSYNLGGTNYSLVPPFNPSILTYDILLDIATEEVPELEYILEDNRCMVVPDNQTTPNGTSSVKIITWNQDDSLTYTVNFTVELCTTPTLSSLQVDGVTIPNFNPNILNYSVYLPFGTEELPEITAEITCPDGQLEITQITEYPGVVIIVVTAGDGSTQTYTISFSVNPGNNTYLSTIFINGEVLTEFNKNVYFYPRLMPYGITQAPTVEVIPEVPSSIDTIIIVQAEFVGDTAKIYVIALNGDTALYQVHFIPGKNHNCFIEDIWIDWKLLDDFNPYVPEYLYLLPADYTGTPLVTVALQDPNATKKEEWLAIAPPTWQITVTAENGEDMCTYRIVFERENSILTFDAETEIRVYPNPSSDNIHFKIDELIQDSYLEIYSVENKKLGSYTLQGGVNTIQIAHLSKGMYFYKIFTDKAMLGTGKFVKN